MRKLTGILFLLTLVSMILINSCKSTADYYAIGQSKCTQCLQCIPACGFHAISQHFTDTSTYLVIDPNKCVGCGECVIACNKKGYFAIAVGKPNE
jgi:ferredoxin